MNEQNVKYLSGQLEYTGFGEVLQTQLQEKIKVQAPEFTLQHRAKYGEDELHTALHFKKSATSELYFFTGYLASLKVATSTQKLQQRFEIQENNYTTLTEAFNLLQGRAVYKRLSDGKGQSYHAWIELDFKNKDAAGNHQIRRIHQNYGFDLEEALSQLPIRELADPEQKGRLLASLYKGNRAQIELMQGQQATKMFVETSPLNRAIIVWGQTQASESHRQTITQPHTDTLLRNGQESRPQPFEPRTARVKGLLLGR